MAEKPAKLKVPITSLDGSSCELELDPDEKLEFLKSKISQALNLSLGRVSLVCDSKVWTDPNAQLKDIWQEGSTLTLLKNPNWDVARLDTLKAKFVKHGKVEQESHGCRKHDAALPEGCKLPEILVELLKMGVKWTFKDLFHCEMFVLTDDANMDIYGDEECRQDWQEEHGEDSCAHPWWVCIGNSSEYDFYYLNTKESSPTFGQVKRIVNNCDEETVYTEAPFDNYLDAVERYVNDQEKLDPEAEEEDEDYKNFSEYNIEPNGRKIRKKLRL
ncbi:unnamed protein product [Symbiodinium natans]|uniref:Ubiquitin-like domain-containing protein n=1 Tax=Symbiodinium natans TaxID=878477 RepID=A0A812PV13_9DINO|nr:unnamed protein product [Symbiodinium natans]